MKSVTRKTYDHQIGHTKSVCSSNRLRKPYDRKARQLPSQPLALIAIWRVQGKSLKMNAASQAVNSWPYFDSFSLFVGSRWFHLVCFVHFVESILKCWQMIDLAKHVSRVRVPIFSSCWFHWALFLHSASICRQKCWLNKYVFNGRFLPTCLSTHGSHSVHLWFPFGSRWCQLVHVSFLLAGFCRQRCWQKHTCF